MVAAKSKDENTVSASTASVQSVGLAGMWLHGQLTARSRPWQQSSGGAAHTLFCWFLCGKGHPPRQDHSQSLGEVTALAREMHCVSCIGISHLWEARVHSDKAAPCRASWAHDPESWFELLRTCTGHT